MNIFCDQELAPWIRIEPEFAENGPESKTVIIVGRAGTGCMWLNYRQHGSIAIFSVVYLSEQIHTSGWGN